MAWKHQAGCCCRGQSGSDDGPDPVPIPNCQRCNGLVLAGAYRFGIVLTNTATAFPHCCSDCTDFEAEYQCDYSHIAICGTNNRVVYVSEEFTTSCPNNPFVAVVVFLFVAAAPSATCSVRAYVIEKREYDDDLGCFGSISQFSACSPTDTSFGNWDKAFTADLDCTGSISLDFTGGSSQRQDCNWPLTLTITGVT